MSLFLFFQNVKTAFLSSNLVPVLQISGKIKELSITFFWTLLPIKIFNVPW